MAEIYNFVEVSDALSTSGIIPVERLQHLADVSIYGQLYLGWSTEKAQALIDQLWQPNDVWREFVQSELDRGHPLP
jgi:hypothetical protein